MILVAGLGLVRVVNVYFLNFTLVQRRFICVCLSVFIVQ